MSDMKAPPAAARVLIATDNAATGVQVRRLLEDYFAHFSVSSDPGCAVADFEGFKPDVVVLAFDAIEKAQGYCLGLYRFGTAAVHEQPHRTILLCAQAQLATAFELCMKQYFDDYVLHWPLAHDGRRLPMSVWIASREVIAARCVFPARPELRAHAKHVRDLEAVLDVECSAATQKIAGADSALSQLEQEFSSASDEFAHRLAQGADGTGGAADLAALSVETARLKALLAAKTHALREQTLTPLMSWADNLRSSIEPALAGARELAENIRSTRPVILVVDDDGESREALVRAVNTEKYDLIFVDDRDAALNQLRLMRPDAILLAIRLPGLDSVGLSRHLKATPQLASIPIIVLTGDSRRETLLRNLEAGAAGFIVKPFSRESLNLKLEKVLGA